MVIKSQSEITHKELIQTLLEGGVIVYPTDTVYGLLANPFHEMAFRRIFHIKTRPFSKPLPLFVDTIERAKTLAKIDERTERVLRQLWPGQVTVILERQPFLPPYITNGERTIALRIPDRDDIRSLISSFNFPLTGTSANLSDMPVCKTPSEVFEQFRSHHPQPDLVVDGGELSSHTPSTILDITKRTPQILRAGPLSKSDFETLFQNQT